MTATDTQLADEVADLDASSFETLFQRYCGDVRLQVGRIVRDAAAVDDVVQEIFLLVWERAGQWRAEGEFRSWLMRIATNTALTHLRKVQRRREQRLEFSLDEAEEQGTAPEWLLESALPGPDAQVERAEERRLVRRLVDELPEDKREAIRLFYDAQMDVREAAERLGVPEGTVKSRLYHGRRQLARSWAETIEEE